MYTVAYWMTGSLKKTNDLVYNTYLQLDSGSTEVELFKTFRNVYYVDFFHHVPSLVPDRASENAESLGAGSHKDDVDGRLAVLLAEVCQLKHQSISKILDKPVEIIRCLLTSERKAMLLKTLNLILAFFIGESKAFISTLQLAVIC
jgi:hypothetical protein